MIFKKIIIQFFLSDLIYLHINCELKPCQGTFNILQKNSYQNQNDGIFDKKNTLICAAKCLETFKCQRVAIIDEKCILRSYFETNNLWNPDLKKTVLEKVRKGKKIFFLS